MRRRDFLKQQGASGIALSSMDHELLARARASHRRPNIVNILVDDLGWGDLGCYGNTDIETPNIERLASQGTLFTQYYGNGATCMPTWSALRVFSQMNWDKRICPVRLSLDTDPHELAIQVIKDEIIVFIDGSQRISAKDSDIASVSFNLRTWMAEARFADAEVFEIKVKN